MAESAQRFAVAASAFFEVVALVVIMVGFLVALWRGAVRLRASDGVGSYDAVRSTFGRSVLLGLEILVAADLIRTVSVTPTLSGLAVLGGLVLIRTFLSWSFQVEIDGRWPWQRDRDAVPEGRTS